jgi:hypothetical protein
MKILKRLFRAIFWMLTNFKSALSSIENGMFAQKGQQYSENYTETKKAPPNNTQESNPFQTYFDNHSEGHGIWKWTHYFDIYHRHFKKFIGKEVHIVEVGIYSGGSLPMWQKYFGDKCIVHGIDIEKDCLRYQDENKNVKIYIGDQESREFWREFKSKVPKIDILVDDGGHLVGQQIVTLEEMLPHISPGGVFLCEDICGNNNKFTSYVNGLHHDLNNIINISDTVQSSKNTFFQQQIASIHQYPFVCVIEKREQPLEKLSAPKHGTIWGPFFKAVEA